MARPFYPFVDNDPEGAGDPATPPSQVAGARAGDAGVSPAAGDTTAAQAAPPQATAAATPVPQATSSAPTAGPVPAPRPARRSPSASEVDFPARIAVYDDAAAAPRVVIVDPKDVRSYLEEITKQVTSLSHEQGGTIPFTVIREIVENFIHAYFIEPTISILDSGNTIRFSDQGPGIKEKERALEYGTSSATEEMKRYIRGVGSGLPYVQQYMEDKGGSLTVEDNISQGTVVTISTKPRGGRGGGGTRQAPAQPGLAPEPPMGDAGFSPSPHQQAPGYPSQPATGPYPYGLAPAGSGAGGQDGYPQQQGWAHQGGPQQPWGQRAYPQASYPQGGYQQGGYLQEAYPQASYPQAGYQQPGYQRGSYPPSGYPQQAAAQEPFQAQAPYQQPQPSPEQSGAAPQGQDPFSWVRLTARGRAALAYLASNGSVGPSDLQRAYGESQPTWTRELKQLEEDGLVKKDGQKRRLTGMGRAFVESHPLA